MNVGVSPVVEEKLPTVPYLSLLFYFSHEELFNFIVINDKTLLAKLGADILEPRSISIIVVSHLH